MPVTKYEERRAGVCAYLCISIVSQEVLKFRETIALQRYVLSPQDPLARLSRKQRYYIKDLPQAANRKIKTRRSSVDSSCGSRGLFASKFSQAASARHFLQDQVKTFNFGEVIVERNERRF